MDIKQLQHAISRTPVREIRVFETIGSTNDVALDWADNRAPDFSLVIANEQTKGRGRFDRQWVTKPGSSLAFSLILKPSTDEVGRLHLFAPLCGLAVHDAFHSLFDLDAEIKWPNDILINRKKCSGILVEAAWSGNVINRIVLGIGINVSLASLPPPELQLFTAMCLEYALNKPVDRFQVLTAVLQSIHKWRSLIGTDEFFAEWQRNLAFKGERVMIVDSEKQSIIGIEKGIDELGRLVLILENKGEIAFEVGDVHLRPADFSLTGGTHA